MRDTTGSAAAHAARWKNLRRGSFMMMPLGGWAPPLKCRRRPPAKDDEYSDCPPRASRAAFKFGGHRHVPPAAPRRSYPNSPTHGRHSPGRPRAPWRSRWREGHGERYEDWSLMNEYNASPLRDRVLCVRTLLSGLGRDSGFSAGPAFLRAAAITGAQP